MAATRKCLVWDLDNTLWEGICLEGEVTVPEASRQSIEELDRRGILLSIASRGQHEAAWPVLEKNRLDHYFLSPRINWLPKPTNLVAIARELNLGLDALAFIDDDPFEREQMRVMLPEVVTIDATRVGDLPSLPEFQPEVSTPESLRRRELYQAEERRRINQDRYVNRPAFLHSCRMRLTVRPADERDVPRIRELMSRTHQLNTTGLMMSEGEALEVIRDSLTGEQTRELWVGQLTDRFGDYGTVGLALTRSGGATGTVILDYLAMSCRILGRGVERAFLSGLLEHAGASGHQAVKAQLRETGRNRMMRVLYQSMGLKESLAEETSDTRSFEAGLDAVQAAPTWVTVR